MGGSKAFEQSDSFLPRVHEKVAIRPSNQVVWTQSKDPCHFLGLLLEARKIFHGSHALDLHEVAEPPDVVDMHAHILPQVDPSNLLYDRLHTERASQGGLHRGHVGKAHHEYVASLGA